MNDRSSVALENIRDIKSQADIHVQRIEKVSEIGKNLTNNINSARNQVGKLLEQLKSLQTSLSKFTKRHDKSFSSFVYLDYSTQINKTHLENIENEFAEISLDFIFDAIDQFSQGTVVIKNRTDQFILQHEQLNEQVKNLLDIAQALPTGCFKTIAIENSDDMANER